MTEEQYADLQRRQLKQGDRVTSKGSTFVLASKPSKYRNVRCQSADGKTFDSKLERDYYERQLLPLWKSGYVLWFVRQVNFELEGGVVYRADFVVNSAAGVHVIDTTGVLTPTKANKLKQMKARYGIEVQLVRNV